jgi:hypothetical protein
MLGLEAHGQGALVIAGLTFVEHPTEGSSTVEDKHEQTSSPTKSPTEKRLVLMSGHGEPSSSNELTDDSSSAPHTTQGPQNILLIVFVHGFKHSPRVSD